MPRDPDTAIGGRARHFPDTSTTMVVGLRSGDEELRARALETLVALYWKPLYRLIRIQNRVSNEDAKDLVQAFFEREIDAGSLARFDPSRGTFRTFIRLLFERFAANEAKAATRVKRGGRLLAVDFDDAERELAAMPSASLTPEEVMEREWARSLFALAVERLRVETAELRAEAFVIFTAYDLDGEPGISYAILSQRHGIPETTVTNHLSAMRRRFRAIVLQLLEECTATREEFLAEARALLGRAP